VNKALPKVISFGISLTTAIVSFIGNCSKNLEKTRPENLLSRVEYRQGRSELVNE
jgi:hypothetical protein